MKNFMMTTSGKSLKVSVITAIALSLLSLATCSRVSYSGYQIFRVLPSNDRDVAYLSRLEVEQAGFDFRNQPNAVRPIDIMVSPGEIDKFKSLMGSFGIEFEVRVTDVERATPSIRPVSSTRVVDFEDYNTVAEIHSFQDELAERYPNKVSTILIGKTWEGRDLKVSKISKAAAGTKLAFWIDAGVHAREWIAPAMGTYLLNELATKQEHDDLLDLYDFYILPSNNPDGYEYTWTTDRQWRKTRSDHGNRCIGVDPNRNWDFHWGGAGSNDDSCSPIYRGPYVFSESELLSVADFASTQKFDAALTLHSIGQIFMAPWTSAKEEPSNSDELLRVSGRAAEAIFPFYNTTFTFKVIGGKDPPAGGSTDWWYANAGVPYAYAIELREAFGGEHDVVLPPEQIIPSGIELTAGFRRIALDVAEALGGIKEN